MILLPLAHIVSKFILEGKSYEVEDFKISFSQAVDFKGQPQHEMLGGQLYLTLTQAADDNLYFKIKRPSDIVKRRQREVDLFNKGIYK